MKTTLKSGAKKLLTWPRRHWKLTILLLLIVVAVGFWWWRRSYGAQTTYQTVNPQVKDLVQTIEVSGVVDAKQKASLRFANGGKLVYLGAKEGDTVRQHQTIATIDQRELQKRLQQDLNAYLRQRMDLDNMLYEYDYDVETSDIQDQIDETQLFLNDSVLSVEIRDISIQNTVLSAPFAGMLVKAPQTVAGALLLSTDVFELVDPASLIFKAAVDEADIAQVKIGQSVNITLDAYPDIDIEGTVTTIGYQSLETSTGTVFLVEIPLTNVEASLGYYRLGMNGDVAIETNRLSQVVTIPITATRMENNQMMVDVLDPATGQPVPRVITTGAENDDEVEVTSGLSTEDQVVIPEF